MITADTVWFVCRQALDPQSWEDGSQSVGESESADGSQLEEGHQTEKPVRVTMPPRRGAPLPLGA